MARGASTLAQPRAHPHALDGLLVPAERYYGRVEEVLARIEAGAGCDACDMLDLRERCPDLFRVTSKGGVAEVWLLGQRLLELPDGRSRLFSGRGGEICSPAQASRTYKDALHAIRRRQSQTEATGLSRWSARPHSNQMLRARSGLSTGGRGGSAGMKRVHRGLLAVRRVLPGCHRANSAVSVGGCDVHSILCGVQIAREGDPPCELKCTPPDTQLPMSCTCMEAGVPKKTTSLGTKLPTDVDAAEKLARTACGW